MNFWNKINELWPPQRDTYKLVGDDDIELLLQRDSNWWHCDVFLDGNWLCRVLDDRTGTQKVETMQKMAIENLYKLKDALLKN